MSNAIPPLAECAVPITTEWGRVPPLLDADAREILQRMSGLGTILTAMITPFEEGGGVNEESFVALMRHLAENGSDGFVVAGTTGEASTLTDEEQLGLIELAVAERPAGKTIIAGTGTNDTRQAVHLTERATELGADAMLSVTPYYNKPSRLGLRRHYEAVAAATDKPTLLYNIPGRTATNMPPDLLAELAQIEGIVGVKQANAAELLRSTASSCMRETTPRSRARWTWGARGGSSSRVTSSATRCAAWWTSPSAALRSTRRCATSTRRCSSPRAQPARRPR